MFFLFLLDLARIRYFPDLPQRVWLRCLHLLFGDPQHRRLPPPEPRPAPMSATNTSRNSTGTTSNRSNTSTKTMAPNKATAAAAASAASANSAAAGEALMTASSSNSSNSSASGVGAAAAAAAAAGNDNSIAVDAAAGLGANNQNSSNSSSNNSSHSGESGADLTSKTIVFKADEKSFCFETKQRPSVTVIGSTGNHDHGSSKVKLKNIVDYKWDLRHYPGRLITVHIDGKHLAYAIVVRSNEGMVRVVNPTNGQRALIKGLTTEVLDLQFAHIRNQMILATIEERALHLHRIDTVADKIVCTQLLRICDNAVPNPPMPSSSSGCPAPLPPMHRVTWCPYVPEKEGDCDEFVSQQLVWVRGAYFRCYSVRSMIDAYSVGAQLDAAVDLEGSLSSRETTGITAVALSPDGSTLVVGGEDGVCRFYQVYFHTNENSPRCLHQWVPHSGQAANSIFFLDNLTRLSKDKGLWRHAITGAADNTEIKVWCCATWECLQTIRFQSPSPTTIRLQLTAQIDRTSSYLVLADSRHRQLYVLQVQIDTSGSPPRNHAEDMHLRKLRSHRNVSLDDVLAEADEAAAAIASGADDSGSVANSSAHQQQQQPQPQRSMAYIKSISQFPLSSAILSFHIVDAAVRRYKCGAFQDLVDELDDYDEDSNSLCCVVINMYLVQPKSVQECHVLYQPTVAEDAEVLSSLEHIGGGVVPQQLLANGGSVADGTAAQVKMEPPTSSPIAADQAAASSSDAHSRPTSVLTLEKLMAAAAANAAPLAAAAAATAPSSSSIATTSGSTIDPVYLEKLIAYRSPPQSVQQLEQRQKHESIAQRSPGTTAVSGTGAPISLMTPDSFQSPREARETPEGVSSDVRSALQMLAAQAQQQQHHAQAQQQQQQQQQQQSLSEDSGDSATANVSASGDQAQGPSEAKDASPASSASDNQQQPTHATHNNQIMTPECGASLLAAAVAAVASGGSSPSREVQEILSPKNSDCINDFFDDSTDLSDDDCDDNEDDTNVAAGVGAGDKQAQYNFEYNINKPNSQKAAHGTKASLSGAGGGDDSGGSGSGNGNGPSASTSTAAAAAWPKVPTVPSRFPAPPGTGGSNLFNNINAPQQSQAGGGQQQQQLAPVQAQLTVVASAVDSAAIVELGNKMDQMLELMQAQACQIEELRTAAMLERKRADEAQLQLLMRTRMEHDQRLAEYQKAQMAQARDICNQVMASVNMVVTAQVGDRIAAHLKADLQQQVIPIVVQRLDQIAHRIQSDVAHRLTSSDQLLRENIMKVCSSKHTMEVFGNAVLLGVQAGLQKTHSETMRTTLVPAYEKASAEMFKQVQEVFTSGTKAYTKLFDTYYAQYEPVHKQLQSLSVSLPADLRLANDATLAAHTQKIAADMQRDLKAMQAQIVQTVRDNVKNEMKRGFDQHTATIEDSVRAVVAVERSQSQTPAPPTLYDLQEQIRAQLGQQQVNSAFHQALVANDLALVEFTIEKADFAAVFHPCPLQQTVLLSLIQQISADMSNHNELKHRYMAEAILNLDMRDATTKEHAPKVLRELYRHCQAYTAANPGNRHNSGLRMLMMAVQGLGIKLF